MAMIRTKRIAQLSKVALAGMMLGFGLAAGAAMAADFGGRSSGDTCFLMRRSPILDLKEVDQMQTEVERRYEHALGVSESKAAIANQSPRFLWAIEAKAACGKAIGYFYGREINEDMVSKCDCYHGRMLRYMH